MGRKTRFSRSIDIDYMLFLAYSPGHKFPFIDWFCVFMFHHAALCYLYGNNFLSLPLTWSHEII